jgi:hypothetical protein
MNEPQLAHTQDAHGRCVSQCYACERTGLQERIQFTQDYESVKFHHAALLAALDALVDNWQDEALHGRGVQGQTFDLCADALIEVMKKHLEGR